MGGRGSKTNAENSVKSRAEARTQTQIDSARAAAPVERQRGLPLGPESGGVLNNERPLSEHDLSALDNELNRSYSGWANSLTSEERNAVVKWNTPGYYSDMNQRIFKGEALTGEQQKTFDTLSSLMGKTSVPKNMTVYRGVKYNTSVEDAKGMVGKEFKAGGIFLATSASFERASHFSGNPKFGNPATSEGTVYKITVPKGAKGAWLNASKTGILNEHELLMSPTSTFKVTGYRRIKTKAGYDYSGGATYDKTLTEIHMVYMGG